MEQFKFTGKTEAKKAMEAAKTQLEQSFEDKYNNYDNAANSLIKGSITNAIRMAKNSKNEEVRANAYRIDAEVNQMQEYELVNQNLFNDLYKSIGSDARVMEQLEVASELSAHDKFSMREALAEPYVKLKESSIDDAYEAKISSLNGDLYYQHKESGELLTKDEFNFSSNSDLKYNKDLVAKAGFNSTGPNGQAAATDTTDGVEFSGLAQAKADMGL